MNTKTMEGLVGAGVNMKIRDTPMRVYKEAEREGNIAKMERAMGYANKFAERSWEYQSETDEGMKEEAEEAKEKEKLEQEKAIEKRREDREKQEERVEETGRKDTDTIEVSEEGKERLKENQDLDHAGYALMNRDNKPVIYTKEGKAIPMQSYSSLPCQEHS